MNDTTSTRLAIGQRVRYRNSRNTGRVTGTWQHPGDEFYPAQPGVMVTMDSQYSPPPVPVRFRVFESDFEPLPDDYLDDSEAMEQIAAAVTHIPGDLDVATEMLSTVLAILRRNDRIRED
jgi:hypothetical protein